MSELKIEAGKRYIAKDGTIVGPMEEAITTGRFRCSNRSLRQVTSPANSQVWNNDGSVHAPSVGEYGHTLVAEFKVLSADDVALSAAKGRVLQLESELSDARSKLGRLDDEVKSLKESRDEAVQGEENWKSRYLKEKYGRNLWAIEKLAPPAKKQVPQFPFVMNTGGLVRHVNRDAERSLDYRIDGAFDAIRRLQSEIERDIKSTNGRAVFFGALGASLVVAVAFLAHFLF